MAETEIMEYERVWNEKLQEAMKRVEEEQPDLHAYERILATLPIALQSFLIACYSHDRIAAFEDRPWGLLSDRMGAELEAVSKHHWLPSEVRKLSDTDLFLALHDELTQHQYRPEVYRTVQGRFLRNGMSSHIRHLDPDSAG